VRTKRFSKKLFDENDARAREAALKFLVPRFAKKGWEIDHNPDKYGPDLLVTDKDGVVRQLVECEIRNSWKSGRFPWSRVQLFSRKEKYLSLYGEKMSVFVCNDVLTHALFITGKQLLDAPQEEVPNKYVPRGEFFRIIPIEECKQYRLEK